MDAQRGSDPDQVIGLVANPSKSWLSGRIWSAVSRTEDAGRGSSMPPGRSESADIMGVSGEAPDETPYAFLRIVGTTALFAVGGAIAYVFAEALLDVSAFSAHGFAATYGLALCGLTLGVLSFRAMCVSIVSDDCTSSDRFARRTALSELVLWGLTGLWMPTVVLATVSYGWVPLVLVLAGAVATDILATRVTRSFAPAH